MISAQTRSAFADRIGVRGDQQVVSADWLSGRFQLRADSAVFGVGWNVKR
jgi:hypothetical protein